jgi:hypothetical protein
MAIPQHFIQELLARVDVVEVVGRYVQLKKGGANFMGLCPFHGEKSPSFSVSPAKQFFHCFGCGKNGNAIGFLMARRRHLAAGPRSRCRATPKASDADRCVGKSGRGLSQASAQLAQSD